MRAGEGRSRKQRGKGTRAGAFVNIAAARAGLGMVRQDAGWSTSEYMKRFQVNYAVARNEIERLLQAGELVKGLARRRDAQGILRRVSVYRPAPARAGSGRG